VITETLFLGVTFLIINSRFCNVCCELIGRDAPTCNAEVGRGKKFTNAQGWHFDFAACLGRRHRGMVSVVETRRGSQNDDQAATRTRSDDRSSQRNDTPAIHHDRFID
jgi:hypothetical protein